MTQIVKLNHHDNSSELISDLKDKELLVYEDIQGSTLFIKYTGTGFIIKSKSLNNDPLSFLDLAIQKFYNKAFFFFHSLPEYVTNLLNHNWWFVFEYFPDGDNAPANVEYDHLPKNNLILTCIVKGNKYIYNYEEIAEYARLFECDPLPVIFKGTLTGKQIEVINLFLNTSEEDLKYVFGEKNFAYFFYKILNPNIENSFLMDTGKFNDNLEKIVIKIDGDPEFSFEVFNPLYDRVNTTNNTEYLQIYSIILVDFLEFCQLKNLKDTKLTKFTRDELYIELISKFYNDYISNVKDDISKWDFTIPKFFIEEKFKINTDLIENSKTVEYIKSDPKFEYVYKVILGSFSNRKKKPIGVFTEQTLKLFNDMVDRISNFIDKSLKINRDFALQKQDLINFKDFFKLKYSTDSQGDVYPNIGKELELGGSGEKKKKKGIVKGKGKKI